MFNSILGTIIMKDLYKCQETNLWRQVSVICKFPRRFPSLLLSFGVVVEGAGEVVMPVLVPVVAELPCGDQLKGGRAGRTLK